MIRINSNNATDINNKKALIINKFKLWFYELVLVPGNKFKLWILVPDTAVFYQLIAIGANL